MGAVMLACCGIDNVDMLQLLVGEYKMDPNVKDLVRADTACTAGLLLSLVARSQHMIIDSAIVLACSVIL